MQFTYHWICPKCKKQYETPQPVPANAKHYICPDCYYKLDKGSSQMDQCIQVIREERKGRLCD